FNNSPLSQPAIDSVQPNSDSDPVARTSKLADSKIELSSSSALLQISFIGSEDCTLSHVGLTMRGVGYEVVGPGYGFFRTNTAPRLVSSALPAKVNRTESRMSLLSNLKLVTPATLLSGSLY